MTHLPVLRGSHDGADCGSCPFSTCGEPTKPVYSEYPEKPLWLLIGEGPGRTEVYTRRPFQGPSGQVVNKLLAKIGRPREHIGIINASLCMPPYGSPDSDREKAAKACKERLRRELAQFPGIPILTLGAVAAREVIPKDVLDAIDPPDVPKSRKRAQKDRQRVEAKAAARRLKAIRKIYDTQIKKAIKYRQKQIIDEVWSKHQKKPTPHYIDQCLARERKTIEKKSWQTSEEIYEERLRAREEKKKLSGKTKKKKPIKITDIMSSTFTVDVDGTGPRHLIPAIHPAALLRGGGAMIGGTHSPDLGYINLTYDAIKVDSIARGKDIFLRFNVELEWQDPDRATELFLRIFHQAIAEDEVAIDLETYVHDTDRHHALMAYVANIRAIGFATKNLAISVYWDLLPSWCQSLLQVLLGSVKCTYHNALYDTTVFRGYGFILDDDLIRFEDTLLMHHAAFPGCAHNLQQVTTQFFAMGPWKSMFRNQEETPNKLTEYNAKDTATTLALRPALQILVKRNNVERVYNRDKKMVELASMMHIHGMPVSREVNQDLLVSFDKLARESRAEVDSAAADPKIREEIFHHLAVQQATKQRKADPNEYEQRYKIRLAEMKTDTSWYWKINSGKHVAALLMAMGVSLTQRTEHGEISTKKEILENLTHVPIVRKILKYRENEKALGTFVWPIFDRHDEHGHLIQPGFVDENDRVHPVWSTHKISGRWASWDPVVSNALKELVKRVACPDDMSHGEFADYLRKQGYYNVSDADVAKQVEKDGGYVAIERPTSKRQFVAPLDRAFVSFDLAQLEARIIALISGDPFLLDVFATGKDIHTECAMVVFADRWASLADGSGKMSKAQKRCRTVTKNLEYGAFYGGAIETLWKTLLKDGHDVKLADVARSVAILMARMPGVVRWQRDTVLKASTPPYTLWDFVDGRMRIWPMGQVEQGEALNIVPQSTGAAIMNTGMERMMANCLKYKQAWPIVQVHDAAVFECWADDAEKLKEDLDRDFPQVYERDGISIPFPIESTISTTWARSA